MKRTLCYSPKRPRVITKISVVLGLADTRGNDQGTVYGEFKEKLERNRAGCYETKLPWKDNHPTLPTNEMGSRRRVEQLIKWLRRNESYKNYNNIIQDQLQQGVIKMARNRAVNKGVSPTQRSESVNRWLRPRNSTYSLRCFYKGEHPAIIERLPPPRSSTADLNTLEHPRKCKIHPVLVICDFQTAFLQIRIKEEEREIP